MYDMTLGCTKSSTPVTHTLGANDNYEARRTSASL